MANYTAPAAKTTNGQLLHTEWNSLAAEAQELSEAMPTKAPAASPTFTGTVTVPDGSFTVGKTSGLQAALDGKLTIGGDSRPQLPQNWAFFGDSITNIGEGYPFYAQVASKGRLVAEYVQSNPGQDSAFLLTVAKVE